MRAYDAIFRAYVATNLAVSINVGLAIYTVSVYMLSHMPLSSQRVTIR